MLKISLQDAKPQQELTGVVSVLSQPSTDQVTHMGIRELQD